MSKINKYSEKKIFFSKKYEINDWLSNILKKGTITNDVEKNFIINMTKNIDGLEKYIIEDVSIIKNKIHFNSRCFCFSLKEKNLPIIKKIISKKIILNSIPKQKKYEF